MNPLTPAEQNRLASMLARAEADQNPADGERIAALLAAERLLHRHGMRLRDLAHLACLDNAPGAGTRAPDWRRLTDDCLCHTGSLRPWERDFLQSLRGFPRASPKQRQTLHAIAERIGVWP